MSVREFAAHLGVSDRMVSKWEAGGEAIRPRPLNQSALDTSLALADADVKTRFTHIAIGHDVTSTRRRQSPAQKLVPEQAVHFVRHPLDSKLMTLIDSGPLRMGAGRRPIWLPGYYIDVQPITNAEYTRFLEATGRRPPPHWPEGRYSISDPDVLHSVPVSNVSWDDATAYAHWADKEISSSRQWDRAAKGAEGATITELWEWVRTETGPGRRGHKGGRTGGFRCTCPAPALLSLLAI